MTRPALPPPKPLTPEQMEQATHEAQELARRLQRATEGMEGAPGNVRLR